MKYLKKYSLLFFLILIFNSCIKPGNYIKETVNNVINDPVFVRVLLYEGGKPASVISDNEFTIKRSDSAEKIYSGRKEFIITSEDVAHTFKILPGRSHLKYQGKPYRGFFQVIKSGSRFSVINHVNIEEYLYSVVAGEIPSSWPMESLKAQAVAARTYAHHHFFSNRNRDSLYDLKATTSSQVYKGASAERKETNRAVDDTAGIIMIHKDHSIMSFFHSSCGGRTADYKTVWNIKDLDYLKQVDCNYCSPSPDYEWDSSLTMNEIREKIGRLYKFREKISGITFEKEAGRISQVEIKHDKGIITVSGNKFRLLFEPKKIRSLNFTAKKTKGGISLKGRGWGHGVGMCQWGAKGLAKTGHEYRDILKYYYKDISFSSIINNRVASR